MSPQPATPGTAATRLWGFFIGDSWKTTLAGYFAAVVTAALPVLGGSNFTVKDLVVPIAIALIGRWAKDHDKEIDKEGLQKALTSILKL